MWKVLKRMGMGKGGFRNVYGWDHWMLDVACSVRFGLFAFCILLEIPNFKLNLVVIQSIALKNWAEGAR